MLFEWIKKHIVLASILVAVILTLLFGVFVLVGNALIGSAETNQGIPLFLIIMLFLLYPITLTGFNVFFMFADKTDLYHRRNGKRIEYITLVLGVIFTGVYLPIHKVLYLSETHTPVFTGAQPTVVVLTCIGVLGYLGLSIVELKHMSPLVMVFSMAAMYIGIILSILWAIQLSGFNQIGRGDFSFERFFTLNILPSLLPLNCILIGIKVVRHRVQEWNEIEHQQREYKNELLQLLQNKLMRSENWMVLAFVLMWPLFGLCICILTFFGQQTDSIIKAWTETSGWTFSQKLPPT